MFMEEIRRPKGIEDIKEGGPWEVGKRWSPEPGKGIIFWHCDKREWRIIDVIIWKLEGIAANSIMASISLQSRVRSFENSR